MDMSTGNMGQVYRECAKLAEATIQEMDRRTGPMDAEISEGSTSNWYLVNTYPGDDVRAMRWLARRRFGVFRPMQQRVYKPRGVAVQGWESVFPGWLFVLVWDMTKMKARIQATPGVMSLLCDPVSGNPVPIADDFVERLRTLGWVYREHAPRLAAFGSHVNVTAARHRKRRPRSSNRIRKAHKGDAARLLKDQWVNASRLDSAERIALLKTSILPHLAGSSSVVADERV